jgi:hypothetical protein
MAYGPAVMRAVDQIRIGEFTLQAVTGNSRWISTRPYQLPVFTARDLLLLGKDEVGSSIGGAVQALSRLSQQAPERVEAPYWKARGLLLLDHAQEAKQELGRILRGHPDFVPARVLLAGLDSDEPAAGQHSSGWQRSWLEAHEAIRNREWELAETAYTELIGAIDSSPEPYIGSAVEFLHGRAHARLEVGNITRAIEDLLRARERGNNRMETTLLLGKARLLQAAKYGVEEFESEAERLFEELYAEAPSPDEAAVWITLVYRELRDDERALDWARRVTVPVLGAPCRKVAGRRSRSGRSKSACSSDGSSSSTWTTASSTSRSTRGPNT